MKEKMLGSKKGSKGNAALISMSLLLLGGLGLTRLPSALKLLFRGAPFITVNGEEINRSFYMLSVMKEQRLINAYIQRFGEEALDKILSIVGKNRNAEETAFEESIVTLLLAQEASRVPIVLNGISIAREIASPDTLYKLLGEALPVALFDQVGGLKGDALRATLKLNYLSAQDFEKIVHEFLLARSFVVLMRGGIVASRSLKEMLRMSKAERTFSLRWVDVAGVTATLPDPSQEAVLAAFEEENRKKHAYWSSESRDGILWSFALDSFKKLGDQSVEEGEEGGAQATLVQNPSEIFKMAADRLVYLQDEKAFNFFVFEHGGKRVDLNKIQMSRSSRLSESPALMLFQLAEVGSRAAFVIKNKGYIVELSGIHEREPVDFEVVREQVASDLKERSARTQIKSFLRDGLGEFPVAKAEFLLAARAGSADLPDALKSRGLKGGICHGLYVPGQKRFGSTDEGEYVIELLAVAPTGALEVESLYREEANHWSGLVVSALITVLKERAVIELPQPREAVEE